MNYPTILSVLREFDLITDEQVVEACCEYQKGVVDHDLRQYAFRDEWLARRAAKPWWRRWFISKLGWTREWYDLPIDVRYPPSELESRLQKLMEDACG